MVFNNFLQNLQNKPYATKVKILWGTVSVIGTILIVIWIASLKSEINQLQPNPTNTASNNSGQKTIVLAGNYIRVERAETTDGGMKLYFAVNNTTDDILNFSKLTDIKLNVSDGNLTPIKLTDRQGKPFVQKILSHTSNFGTLLFSLKDAGVRQITFGQMYFERSPEKIFSQTIDLDFSQLKKALDLRT